MLISSVLLVVLLVGMPQLGTCATVAETAKKDTLQLVQVIFRHGDRAPTYKYPNDPYVFEKLWPEGLSQLTSRGKMQQFELGQWIRTRYDGYLGEKYSQRELYVTSSDMDRTIMSLESNLAGLFPPVNHWNPKIDWQPIPLRTIPWKDDKFLHNNMKCPRYYELRRQLFASAEPVGRMNKENQEFIQYCTDHSGVDATTVKDLYPLFDVLYAQHSHNVSLPKWAQEGDILPKFMQLYSHINTWATYTTEMKRLWGGPLLNLMITNMQAIAGHLGSIPDDAHSISHGVNRKMLMYSAHDSTLAKLMNTIGIFEPHCPPYAAALLIELHRDEISDEYYVEIHYRNDTTRAPYVLTPPKCGHPCKLRTLIEISHPLIPTDWVKECQMDSTKPILTMKMHEHDDDFQDDKNNIDGDGSGSVTFNWNSLAAQSPLSSDSFSSPSALQLVFLGIGLLVGSTLAALFIVKVLKFRNGDSYYQDDDRNICCNGIRFWYNCLFCCCTERKSTHTRSCYEQL